MTGFLTDSFSISSISFYPTAPFRLPVFRWPLSCWCCTRDGLFEFVISSSSHPFLSVFFHPPPNLLSLSVLCVFPLVSSNLFVPPSISSCSFRFSTPPPPPTFFFFQSDILLDRKTHSFPTLCLLYPIFESFKLGVKLRSLSIQKLLGLLRFWISRAF